MNTQDKLKEIREACIKANPEIVELKFGCIVEVKNELPNEAIYISEATDNHGAIHFNPTTTYFLKHDIEGSIQVSKIDKIIGRPIRLSDVLMAINLSAIDRWLVDYHGYFFSERPTTKNLISPAQKTRWNLEETLNNQSPDTLNFIHSLIKQS